MLLLRRLRYGLSHSSRLRKSNARSLATIELRPYQEKCIQSCLSAVEEGKRRIAVSLATGGGKTVIFSHLINQIRIEEPRYQTLIVVHRRELVEQAANHCRSACPDESVEIEMSHHHASGHADITVCSLQSLIRRLDKYDKNRIKLIIIDEAHHAASKSYLDILKGLAADSADSKVVVVGFSATLFRRDGLQLASAFDHIVFDKDYLSMIRDNYLCKAKLTSVSIENVSLKGIKLTGQDGDFALKQLADQVNTTANNEATVAAWIDRVKNRKSTIVFAVDIQHVVDLANCFRQRGIDARAVSSRNSKIERTEIIAGFRNGEFPILVNCGILTEGFDSPQIDCVLLCRPTKSIGLLVQMIGRGLRLAPGKEDCHILDMTACLDVGVASVPSLFGLDPAELKNKELTIEQLEALALRKSSEEELEPVVEDRGESPGFHTPLEVSYVDYDDMEEFLKADDFRVDKHITRLSPLAWLQTDVDKYILSLNGKGFIRVGKDETKDPATWTGTYTMALPPGASAYLARPRVLFENVSTLSRAISAADTKAVNLGYRSGMLRNAPWRLGDATPAQKAFMESLGSRDASNRRITRGQAHDFITRFTHGGKSFLGSINRAKKAQHKLDMKTHKDQQVRAAKEAKELEKARRRDKVYLPAVQIGPITA